MRITDVNCLVEVRRGRKLWVKSRSTTPATGTTVLFVHGGCANLQQWRDQEPAVFAQGFSTVTFDAFGCGQSEKPRVYEAYHPEELYKDAEAVLESLVQDRQKVVLVGHSLGAATALRLASEHAADVVGLVLIGPYIPAKEPVKPSFFSLAAWMFYLPEWVLTWLQPSLTEGFLKAAFHKQTWQSQPELVEQERRNSNANPPYMFKALHRQLAGWMSYEDCCKWANFAKPTAVIYGDSDALTPLLPSSKALMQNLGQAELTVVDGASHQVMQEKPQAVNAAILEVLKKVKQG